MNYGERYFGSKYRTTLTLTPTLPAVSWCFDYSLIIYDCDSRHISDFHHKCVRLQNRFINDVRFTLKKAMIGWRCRSSLVLWLQHLCLIKSFFLRKNGAMKYIQNIKEYFFVVVIFYLALSIKNNSRIITELLVQVNQTNDAIYQTNQVIAEMQKNNYRSSF